MGFIVCMQNKQNGVFVRNAVAEVLFWMGCNGRVQK